MGIGAVAREEDSERELETWLNRIISETKMPSEIRLCLNENTAIKKQ